MKVIESDDGMFATVILENDDLEDMNDEITKEMTRVAKILQNWTETTKLD